MELIFRLRITYRAVTEFLTNWLDSLEPLLGGKHCIERDEEKHGVWLRDAGRYEV